MILLRRQNYRHIKLTETTRNECVGVLNREGHFVPMPWGGFIEGRVAKANALALPVKLDVIAYKAEDDLAGNWIKVPEFQNVQGCLLAGRVYAVRDGDRLKIV